jgi:hypothetical protein
LTLAQNSDLKSAAIMLNEARSLYSGRIKKRRNLTSILQLAQAFAVVEPEQSFSFLETNFNYFNDIISAAILLDEFNEGGTVKNEEIRLDTVQSESYRNVPEAVRLIKNLSAADFDRTVNLANKFGRAEVRFFTNYRIAQALLDADAEEFEKNFQQKISQEEYDH